MSQHLVTFIGKRVSVTENDGRLIIGRLRGVDQFTNLILDNAEVLQLNADAPPRALPIGSTVIRGDDVGLIGLVDTTLEASVKREDMRYLK